jgi:hypothetical protein
MPIFQANSLNTTALVVPDLYVQIQPPNLLLINGVPTNVIGAVGAATWGPVNQPVDVGGGSMAQFASFFGNIQPRKYDLGTFVALAVLQGAQAFVCVRVTDGTDVAASGTIVTVSDLTNQITVAGTAHAGDVLTETFVGPAVVVTYTMQAGDTTQTGAVGLAAAINANATLQIAGVSADTPVAGVFKLHYPVAPTSVTASVTGGGATTTLTNAGATTTPNVNAITFSSIYTGSNGNQEVVNISNGSAVGTWKVVVSIPGFVPETFDNIGQNPISTSAAVKGNFVWQQMANAINLGQSGLRGKSNLLTAVAGTSGATPTVIQVALTGGTDGYANISTATMLGVDTVPRTGMYALRNQGCSIGALVDVSDSTIWSTQVSFGIFEGIYMIIPGPASDTLANAAGPVTGSKSVAGIDSYAVKMIFGDWVYWFDPVNNQQRLVSPQGPYCGLLSNLSPQNSTLNKQIFGIVGTQKSITGQAYTEAADLALLSIAGWDVIANPIPAGNMFGSRLGRNASSNAVTHGDNYTRMTNYIAATLGAAMGKFVGQLQSRRPTDKTRAAAKATADAFFQALLDQGMIDDFQNVCDLTNNPIPRIALGYMQLDCQVVFLAVVEYFIINLQGGQSVIINRLSTQPTSTFAASPNSNLISAA